MNGGLQMAHDHHSVYKHTMPEGMENTGYAWSSENFWVPRVLRNTTSLTTDLDKA